MSTGLHKAAVAFTGIGLLLVIVGVAIPYWLHLNVDKAENYFGLWKQCIKSPNGDTECTSVDLLIDALKLVDKDFITPTRGLELVGLLSLAGTIVVSVIHMLVLKDKMLLYFVEAAASIFAGAFMLIGAIVFAAMRNDKKFDEMFKLFDLHAGFALCILAAIFSIVAGVLFIVANGRQ